MPMEYNGRQRTRVHQRARGEVTRADARDERIGFTQPLSKPKGLFAEISFAQVIAGAAAAATSMLLASKIGIAGSVIGAAVSSAVTIVCSQLYRRALDASADKLRNSKLASSVDANLPNVTGADAEETRRKPYVSGFDTDAGAASSNRTVRRSSYYGDAVGRGARMAPVDLQIRAAGDRSRAQRKVIVASIILAVLAVALTAGAILVGTAGRGLGEKPASIISAPAGATAQKPNGAAGDSKATGTSDARDDAGDGTATSADSGHAASNGTDSGSGKPADSSSSPGTGTGSGSSDDGTSAGGEPAGNGTDDNGSGNTDTGDDASGQPEKPVETPDRPSAEAGRDE